MRALSLLTIAFMAGCGDDEAPPADSGRPDGGPRLDAGLPTESLAQRAAGRGLSSFVAAAESAGLSSTLRAPGELTVFAPTNEAIAAAGALPSDPGLLANVLLHHVLPYEARSGDVLGASSLRNSANNRLLVDAAAEPPTVGGAGLAEVDLLATNGVLHVVDRVIVPPSIPEAVAATPDLSTLLTVLGQASGAVRDALAAAGPITVFAPTNAAFDAIDQGPLLADRPYLDEVLRYHVANGQTLRAELRDGQVLMMANGQPVTVRVEAGGNVRLVDAQQRTAAVVVDDIRLANGVVHMIDRVLLPTRAPVNLVETLRRNNLNRLITAATTAGLGATLSNDGPFTIFAPTDEAFMAAGATLPTNSDLLANVLLNHVVAGAQTTSALARTPSATSVAGNTLLLDFGSDPATVGTAGFTRTTDQIATNGVVHVVDRVIVPPTVAGAVTSNGDFSALAAAVGQASEPVRMVLGGANPITVFAPVNAAFAGVDVAALAAGGRLDDILTYHVATGQTLAEQLQNGQSLTMSNGSRLTVRTATAGVILVDGTGQSVRVVRANVRLRNGVVHVIDRLLDPGHVVQRAFSAGLTRLLAAAQRAELLGTLATTGPITVLAPTNAAFDALPFDASLLPRSVIETILLYHVVPGALSGAQIVGRSTLPTLTNLGLAVTSTRGGTLIGGSPLGTTRDIAAANGVIHLMDGVIIPPTVVEVALERPDTTLLEAAVLRASAQVQAQLDPDVLAAGQPITVFAPVDAAFSAQQIDPSALSAQALDPILRHHVLAGQLLSARFGTNTVVASLNQNLTLNVSANGDATVTDASGNVARVIARDVRVLNGVVHLIDRVLLPR